MNQLNLHHWVRVCTIDVDQPFKVRDARVCEGGQWTLGTGFQGGRNDSAGSGSELIFWLSPLGERPN
jgi:hypothetical protein